MGNKFVLNKSYICTSITGSTPSFEEVGNSVNSVSLWDMMGKPIYILDSGKRYKYTEKIVTFEVGEKYIFRKNNPFTLEGKVSIPSIQPSKTMADASYFMDLILNEHCIHQPKSVLRVLMDILDWEIRNKWDRSKKGMQALLTERVLSYMEDYEGSWNGASQFDLEKKFILSVIFPNDYMMLRAAESLQLPCKPTMEWPVDKPPVIKIGEKEFKDWFLPFVRPVEE